MAIVSAQNFASKDLYHILILRHHSAALRTQDYFLPLDLPIISCPLFDVALLDHDPIAFTEKDYAIITSATAVEALSEHDIRQLRQARLIFIVGKKTYDSCRARGLLNLSKIFAKSDDLITYMCGLSYLQEPQHIVHICGNITHFDYESLLTQRIRVSPNPIYELKVSESNLAQLRMILKQYARLIVPVYSAQMADILTLALRDIDARDMILLPMSGRIQMHLQVAHAQFISCDFYNRDDIKNHLQARGVFAHYNH